MGKGRMEAFSDGVIAVIITIMVLEMVPPRGSGPEALRSLIPSFASYILSYLVIGIYWNNHHHMLHLVREVDGRILWANLHLLFWLSLVPFITKWMSENDFAPWPVAVYGTVLFLSGVAYMILAISLVRDHEANSRLAVALGKDFKGKASVAIYALSVPLSFVNRWLALVGYFAVVVMWLIPDRRIEKIPAA